MVKLNELADLVSGSPQFRLTESFADQAPLYYFYSQTDLADDLVGMISADNDTKQIRTSDKVNTLRDRDVVYSLISGTATVVRKIHENYLYTQNYVKINLKVAIDAKYFVYLLNESKSIRKQLMIGLQGSRVLKYTLKQLKGLKIPEPPPIEVQRRIGAVYFNLLRLQALRKRVAQSETIVLLKRLAEATTDE